MMIAEPKLREVCRVISQASTELTMLLGERVELKLITPDVTEAKLAEQIQNEIVVNTIILLVSERFKISVEAILSDTRKRPAPDARKAAALLMHKYCVNPNDTLIGNALQMDRSTAHYNRNQAEDLILSNTSFRSEYNTVLKRVKKALAGNG